MGKAILDDRHNFMLLFSLSVWSNQNRMICLPRSRQLSTIKCAPNPWHLGAPNFMRYSAEKIARWRINNEDKERRGPKGFAG